MLTKNLYSIYFAAKYVTYLLSEDEVVEQPRQEIVEKQPEETKEQEPVTKTIIIHQKEIHVCTRCKVQDTA